MAEVFRSFHYDENGEPYMRLETVRQRTMGNYPVAIRHIDAWQFAENKNPQWRLFMYHFCEKAITLLDLGEATTWRMGKIADVIAEGLDKLVKMPPPPTKVVPAKGFEYHSELTVDGGTTVRASGEFTDEIIEV